MKFGITTCITTCIRVSNGANYWSRIFRSPLLGKLGPIIGTFVNNSWRQERRQSLLQPVTKIKPRRTWNESSRGILNWTYYVCTIVFPVYIDNIFVVSTCSILADSRYKYVRCETIDLFDLIRSLEVLSIFRIIIILSCHYYDFNDINYINLVKYVIVVVDYEWDTSLFCPIILREIIQTATLMTSCSR